MPIPTNYRRSSEGAIASYTWTEVSSGIGYSRLYVAKTSSTVYSLIYSSTIAGGASMDESASATSSTAILPSVIYGTAFFEMSLKYYPGSTNARNATFGGVLKLISGSNETTLGTFEAETISTSGYNEYIYQTALKSINISTPTTYKIGDYLKLDVTISGTANVKELVTDPSGTYDSSALGSSALLIPFKLDL